MQSRQGLLFLLAWPKGPQRYIVSDGLEVFKWEIDAFAFLTQLLSVDGVTVYGPQPERRGAPLCAFNVEGIHPTDLSTFLDFEGVGSGLPLSLLSCLPAG